MKKSFKVELAFDKMRIDRWFKQNIKKIPQSLIEKILRKGKIKLTILKLKVHTK